jgi:hypothetical protein
MFRLPREKTDSWFADIKNNFSLDFDVYYFCLIAGLAKGRKETLPVSETKDLINRFPQEYRSESRIIIALFLKKELEKMGVNLEDRKQVHDEIRKYVDYSSPSSLSEEGQREINRYVNGGIEVLKEYFGDRPRTIEAFLIRFSKMIDETGSDQEAS